MKNVRLFAWMNRPNNLSERPKLPLRLNPEAKKNLTMNMFAMAFAIYSRVLVHSASMCNEPLAGKRFVKVTERKTKQDWALFLEEIANQYTEAKKITRVLRKVQALVMDNFETHKPGSLYFVHSTSMTHFQRKKLNQSGTDSNLYILLSTVVGLTRVLRKVQAWLK